MTNPPVRYGKFKLMSNRIPAITGPNIRPRLMNELFRPMATPCPTVARRDVREETAGRSKELANIKNHRVLRAKKIL